MAADREERIDRVVAIVAALVVLAHVVARCDAYGFFRDELYFIACGRHPAFGYVDQPPLIPWIAAASQVFGRSVFLIRLVPALAHGASVVMVAQLAEVVADEAKVDRAIASRAAALATALSTMMIGLHGITSTTMFETLAWTALAWLVARVVLFGETKRLVTCGIVIGLALEAKYAIPFFVAALAVGVLVSPARRALFTRDALVGAGLATLIAAPSLVWQWRNGFPFLDLMHAASHGKNVVVPPLAFLTNQVMVMNPALAPMWIGGVVWALFDRAVARLRFLPIAFVVLLATMIALHGKDYYPSPAYGVAFALGGAMIARFVRSAPARAAYFVVVGAITAIALPTCMPIVAPAALARYVARMHLEEQAQENAQRGVAIPGLMADMTGWTRMEEQVAIAWRTLSDDEKAHAVILASNYGEAGAIDFYGSEDALPPAVTGHNSYWLWGPGMDAPNVVVRVNGPEDKWKPRCESVTLVQNFDAPYAMPYEKDGAIFVCRGMKERLGEMWPEFKSYE